MSSASVLPSAAEPALAAPQPVAPAAAFTPHPFGLRLGVGVFGVFVGAVMSGLNSRVGAIALADVKANFGLGQDDGQWISTIYTAAELAAMPIAAWFSVTFSLRRFHMGVVAGFAALAIVMPMARSFELLLALRFIQGLLGGALIPVLMAAALRFLPMNIRIYGLGLYALTSTFSPNLATWLASIWTDQIYDWRGVYWQVLPLAVLSLATVGWGVPQDPVRLERLRQIDSLGLVTGCGGLMMVAIGLDQAERLDWFASPLITWLITGGLTAFAAFLVSQWYHPLPFVRLQLLGRRNLGLGFTIFVGLLIVLLSGSLLPANHLIHIWGYRPQQLAPIGLAISLPQLVLAPLVAFLLYRRWVDARIVFSIGLVIIAVSCALGSQITTDWIRGHFAWVQALQAIGQPMTVVPLLFLATSVAQPMEGPFLSGLVNTLRAFGSVLGSALIGRFVAVRTAFHGTVIGDRLGNMDPRAFADPPNGPGQLAIMASHQAFVMSVADAYVVLGAVALLLVPAVLNLQRIPAPNLKPAA